MTWGFEWTAEDGTVTNLSDGDIYLCTRFSGYGVPNLAMSLQEEHGRPGAVLRRASLPPRSVSLEIKIRGTTAANHETRLRGLLNELAGSYGRNEPRHGVLKFTREDASVRSLRCIVSGGIGVDTGERQSPMSSTVRAVFTAEYPSWYDPTEKSTTATIGSGGPLKFPITFPATFGLSGNSGLASVAYGGSAESYSLKWTVPGPCIAPRIFSATVNAALRFPYLTVPSGLSLLVRMGWRSDGNGERMAVLTDGSGVETNVLGYMESASRFFRLEPGTNSIQVAQDNEAATVHTFAWFDEYLAAA